MIRNANCLVRSFRSFSSFIILPFYFRSAGPRDYARPSRSEVERKNDEGRKRPEGTHQAVCVANHSFVRESAENNGSPDSRQASFAVGNIGRRELSESTSRM